MLEKIKNWIHRNNEPNVPPLPKEYVVLLSRNTIESIKHGTKCKICGKKFYPKKVIIVDNEVRVLRVCKECE